MALIPADAKDLNKLWQWIFHLSLLAGFFWLKSIYVGQTEFDAYKASSDKTITEISKGITTINETLIRIDEKMKNDARQDVLLEKHESRIQTLERKT